MPDKISDNEVVKALECCMNGCCDDCPFRETREHCHNLDSLILDLINRKDEELNRLQARIGIYETCNARKDEAIKHLESEVKRLQAENERLSQFGGILLRNGSELFKELETAKSEAYKECIEKVKAEIEEALKNNYEVKKEHTEKYINSNGYDEFMNYCNGKIDCLRGLDNFLDNLLNEMKGK